MRPTDASALDTARTASHSAPNETARRPSRAGTVRARAPACRSAAKAADGKAGSRSSSAAPAQISSNAASQSGWSSERAMWPASSPQRHRTVAQWLEVVPRSRSAPHQLPDELGRLAAAAAARARTEAVVQQDHGIVPAPPSSNASAWLRPRGPTSPGCPASSRPGRGRGRRPPRPSSRPLLPREGASGAGARSAGPASAAPRRCRARLGRARPRCAAHGPGSATRPRGHRRERAPRAPARGERGPPSRRRWRAPRPTSARRGSGASSAGRDRHRR